MKLIKYISFIIATTLLIMGCGKGSGDGAHDYRVLVIHSNDSIGEDGAPYQQYMAERFKDEGIDAEIRHYYADLIHTPRQNVVENGLVDLVNFKRFNPDLIIVDGEEMLNMFIHDISNISSEVESLKSSLIKDRPIVFGGVNFVNRDVLSRYQNITGFIDQIDLKRNLEVVNKVTIHRFI